MPHVYDIAILGATPAGYAAARFLAAKGCDVVVVEAPHSPGQSPLTDWCPAGCLDMPELGGSLATDCQASSISRVCYHNVSLDNSAEYAPGGDVAAAFDYRKLCKVLRDSAKAAGVKFRSTTTSPTIQLDEEQISLIGTTQTTARLLLIAHGTPNQVHADLAMPTATAAPPPLTVTALDVPVTAGADETPDDAMHIVELGERSEIGMFFCTGQVMHIRVISSSAAAGSRATELSAMIAGCQRVGLLPADLQLGRAKGALWHPPAGAALELETHVAKRCLLAGTAGGFADSTTGQTLLPSVQSAILAGQTALAALDGPDTQEILAGFEPAWRSSLGDYLRPPATLLNLLLPLLFINDNIVSRFSEALLFGRDV